MDVRWVIGRFDTFILFLTYVYSIYRVGISNN